MSRIEKDCLGQMEVPDDVYYGIQTLRVMGVSGVLGEKVIKYPYLHRALVQMKKAAALANRDIGALDEKKAEAIAWACDQVLTGKYDDQFPLDMLQTSILRGIRVRMKSTRTHTSIWGNPQMT